MNRIGWMARPNNRTLWLLPTLLLCAGISSTSAQTLSDSPRRDLWIADGDVHCLAQTTCTLYLGGAFTYVGPNTGPCAAISAASGQAIPPFANVNYSLGAPQKVYAVASDGKGGWFIGGDFSHVSGVPRLRLAHILAIGTLDPTWGPAVDSAGAVVYGFALAGSTLFLCGSFDTIDGQPRKGLAALDAATGALLPWNPNANIASTGICVSGNTVYAVGAFTSISGQSRNRIAALDATTAAATPWDPNADFTVNTVAVSGNTVFVSGTFSNIGGQARYRMAAIDATTGLATAFNPNPNSGSEVKAIAVSGNTVYAGGDFTTIGGQSRGRIAALDATTGAATSWNPNAGAGVVYAVTVSGTTVYVGGVFTTMGGQSRRNIAALDSTIDSNMATTWNPGASTDVYSIAFAGGVVYAGGAFRTTGGKNRNYIAALDLSTGIATDWNPGANNFVYSMTLSGTTLYVGGDFSIIGGFGRQRIAALDTTINTGNATAWNPLSSDRVNTLAVDGNTVYAGGRFTSIGGQSRNRVAALNALVNTNNATAWNPNANNWVNAIAVSAGTVFVGGEYTSIGGQTRTGLAAVNAASGAVTSWNAEPIGGSLPYVFSLLISGNTLYVGGRFSSIGGQTRRGLAAVDTTTGFATGWDVQLGPGPPNNPIAYAFALLNGTLFVGGCFDTVAGQPRVGIVAVDAASGLASSWNPVWSNVCGAYAVSALGGSVHFAGGPAYDNSVVPHPYLVEYTQPGDVNGDGVNNGDDVGGMVGATIDPAGYAASHPCAPLYNADMDQNGVVDLDDVDLFVTTLLNEP